MKALKVMVLGLFCYVLSTPSIASELVQEFSNPSFSGNGYSTHVLSIEQLRYIRENKIKDDQKSADAAAKRDENNTTINKFIKNVESRIYATLSKQMVDSMFADCDPTTATCATSGTADIEGSTISWSKDATTGEITLIVQEDDGSTTTITIPGAGEFNF